MNDRATLPLPAELQDFDDGFDPFTALMKVAGEWETEDPYPELARLRRENPVQPIDLQTHFGIQRHNYVGDRQTFTVLGYDAVNRVLNSPAEYPNKIYESSLGITFGRSVTVMDGAEHTRHRKLFQAAFTPRMLESLRPRFQAVIDRLVARFEKRGKADLVGEFALLFPFEFIMDLMGMPEDPGLRHLFHKISMAQTCQSFDEYHGVEASRRLGVFLGAVIDQRRALKSDSDFVSVIANAEVEGEQLSHEVAVSFFRQLMNAGGDTSYHGFSNVLTALTTHPEQLEAVRRDRKLLPQAIDEALRWNGPLLAIHRGTTAGPVELEGTQLPAEAFLHVAIGAANRDETVFPDPDRFDIFRKARRHVAFGFGPHVCIGQHLARMELTMALNTLLDRLPNLRLDPDLPAPVIRGLTMRGAEAVHVRFD